MVTISESNSDKEVKQMSIALRCVTFSMRCYEMYLMHFLYFFFLFQQAYCSIHLHRIIIASMYHEIMIIQIVHGDAIMTTAMLQDA